jgi:hypothetical protein
MHSLCRFLGIRPAGGTSPRPLSVTRILEVEISMADLVDLDLPAISQAAAEALGLKVHRDVTTRSRVRQISHEEAEIAVECLREWGIAARIVEASSGG